MPDTANGVDKSVRRAGSPDTARPTATKGTSSFVELDPAPAVDEEPTERICIRTDPLGLSSGASAQSQLASADDGVHISDRPQGIIDESLIMYLVSAFLTYS